MAKEPRHTLIYPATLSLFGESYAAYEELTPEELEQAETQCQDLGHDDKQLTWPRRAWPMVECQWCGRVGWIKPPPDLRGGAE